MLAVIATGIFITYRMVDSQLQRALVATEYGWLLNGKIALLRGGARHCRARALQLAAAARPGSAADRTWPRPAGSGCASGSASNSCSRWASCCWPPSWPTPSRPSTPSSRTGPIPSASPWPPPGATPASCCAPGAAWRCWPPPARRSPSGAPGSGTGSGASASRSLLAVLALGVGLPPLAVDAYPETYRKTPVPFDTISIANGSALFAENCVACHGAPGQGQRRDGQELRQAAGGHAHRAAYRQAYRRRLLPLALLRHSRYRHARICRQALGRGPLGRGQLPARHVARLPGAFDEPARSSRNSRSPPWARPISPIPRRMAPAAP